MNKHIRRRIACIAACAMMLTSVPMAQFTAVAKSGDVLIDDQFNSGVGDWEIYKESGGVAALSNDGGQLAMKISSTGTKTYAVQMYHSIVPLYEGETYRISFDISCTTDRFVECMLQQAGGDYTAYMWEGIDIGPTATKVSKTFTMEYPDDIMSKLVFNCGLQEKDGGALPEHTIFLDNVKIEVLDGTEHTSSTSTSPAVKTNQVGYRTNSKKTVTVRDADSETKFKVVNATTGTVVLNGDLSDAIKNTSAGETDKVGDFSKVTEPGTYYVEVGSLGKSYNFTIGDSVYDAMLADSVKMFYLQRCGCAVEDQTFGHPACHNSQATIYHTNQKIDVTGGWHDAGDYGRYPVAAAKAVADLLYAYLANPDMYNDNLGIPESGNGKPDILDEVKYELDWLMKMQTEEGGVYHKVTCAGFPAFVMPEDEKDELIVMPVSTTATADTAAVMALAAEAYAKVDPSYAEKCLASAEKAWNYLENNGPQLYLENPADISTGQYEDKDDSDERYWAAAQLWRTTGSDKYKSKAESGSGTTGMGWATVGDYGNIAIATWDKVDKTSTAYQNAKNAIVKQADKFKSNADKNAYGSSLISYRWGSNMDIANNGIIMGLAAQLTGDASYMEGAEKQISYLLGSNPTGYSFMTGYGTVTPENPHHRPSGYKKQAMKGMLVGGVNSGLEDDAAKAYCAGAAPALCYVDNTESYSTNEITIYWNSPLTYLLTVTAAEGGTTAPTEDPTESPNPTEAPTQGPDPSGIFWGDADDNKTVDILDVITVNKNLLMGEKMTDQGKKNADVNRNGKVDEADALAILQYRVGLIDKLPIGDEPVVEPTQAPTEAPTQAPTEAPTEAPTQAPQGNAYGIQDKGTPMRDGQKMVSDFRTGDAGDFIASNGWTNGSVFDCWWHESNTSLEGGCLRLMIDQDKGGKGMYSGAEYRTNEFYHYGYYECSLQAIKNDGVVTSFFTYTGPSDVINGVKNPWDEIDIEILGKDTTKVQLNYYRDGKGGHEYMYDLGFDASEGFHTYGFDWYSDHITWYVDGQQAYTMRGDMPKTASKIMMNTWPGVSDPTKDPNTIDWLKPFDGKTPLTGYYQWVTFGNNLE